MICFANTNHFPSPKPPKKTNRLPTEKFFVFDRQHLPVQNLNEILKNPILSTQRCSHGNRYRCVTCAWTSPSFRKPTHTCHANTSNRKIARKIESEKESNSNENVPKRVKVQGLLGGRLRAPQATYGYECNLSSRCLLI